MSRGPVLYCVVGRVLAERLWPSPTLVSMYKGSGRAGARGPRPSSVKDDLGHSEKKKPYQVRRCGVLR